MFTLFFNRIHRRESKKVAVFHQQCDESFSNLSEVLILTRELVNKILDKVNKILDKYC